MDFFALQDDDYTGRRFSLNRRNYQKEMEDFMKVCTASQDFVEIVSADGIKLKSGQEVMIVSGPLQGIRGHLQRVEGHRSRRFIVTIPGACAATVEVKAEEVMPIT